MATAIIREYNPTTGRIIGNINQLSFGHVPRGQVSSVKVVDLQVQDADAISNVRLQITSSDTIAVNDSPSDIRADGSAGNGNFGIEHEENFIPRSTLTRFFAGTESPVEVGTRSATVSEFVHLNMRMNTSSIGSGSTTYQWIFDIS